MASVSIFRLKMSDQGTLGFLVTEGFSCYTLELPWRENWWSISCIPKGNYDVSLKVSTRYGLAYYLENVPNRSGIIIHSGNLAGDEAKGYKTNTRGCILLGQKTGTLEGQMAVLLSRPAVTAFMNHMNRENFKLQIIEVF